MPRKENLSIEERLERAQELFDKKQHQKSKEISKLYSTPIYKLAKKSCIVFLWISQLILIDWALPYLPHGDVIQSGYSINYSNTYKHTDIDKYVNIQTRQYKMLELFLSQESIIPRINDSIVIYKSLLFKEAKKVHDVTQNDTYMVSSSITFVLMPLIIISSVLCLLFLFIKNIEVKAFYYFMFISNIAAVLILLLFYLHKLT